MNLPQDIQVVDSFLETFFFISGIVTSKLYMLFLSSPNSAHCFTKLDLHKTISFICDW